MNRLLKFLTFFLYILSASLVMAEGFVAIPPLRSPVVDNTGALTFTERKQLEQKLLRFSNENGSQVVVLVVESTAPETIEMFSLRVAETWKPGRKGIDDGALLVVATEDRALRIEVGYGLEGALNDATAKRIIDEIIVPEFRRGAIYKGLNKGTDAIIKVIKGEELPKTHRVYSIEGQQSDMFIFAFATVAVLGSFIFTVLGLALGSFIIAAISFLIFIFFFPWYLSLIFSILAVFFSLISHFSGAIRRRSGRYSSYSGGGFRGGGGAFGGGGASGRW